MGYTINASSALLARAPLIDLSLWFQTKYSENYSEITELTQEDIEYLNSIRPTTLYGSFEFAYSMQSMNLTGMDTSVVSDMKLCFWGSRITSLDLSTWDTSRVTTMYSMFHECENLVAVDLSNFDTQNIDTDNKMELFDTHNALQYIIIASPVFKFTRGTSVPSNAKILVPQNLISTYQASSSWLSFVDPNQFDAIENYTITRSNGQITVTPNNS